MKLYCEVVEPVEGDDLAGARSRATEALATVRRELSAS